jgi:hypothetical protein
MDTIRLPRKPGTVIVEEFPAVRLDRRSIDDGLDRFRGLLRRDEGDITGSAVFGLEAKVTRTFLTHVGHDHSYCKRQFIGDGTSMKSRHGRLTRVNGNNRNLLAFSMFLLKLSRDVVDSGFRSTISSNGERNMRDHSDRASEGRSDDEFLLGLG